MKVMGKYFLAILPEPQLLEKVNQLKLAIKEDFGSKYSLKSPPHITLKMPFTYNSAKEDQLIDKLQEFLKVINPFELTVMGTETFGRRVVYLKIHAGKELYDLQEKLKTFCKKELNLVDELSDRNFHPHMTVAFKDIKKDKFDSIFDFVKEKSVQGNIQVRSICLLKRENGQWFSHREISFNTNRSEYI